MQVNEEQNIGGAVEDRKTEQGLRLLDAEVAERVIGEPMPPAPTNCPHFRNILSPQKAWHHIRDFDHGSGECTWEPEPFSTSIEAAMHVVEKMRQHGWSFACTLYEGKLPYASFCKRTVASSRNAEANTLPEAICRAALALVNKPDTNSANSIHPAHGQASKTEVQK